MRKLFVTLFVISLMALPASAPAFQSGFETGVNPPEGGFRTVFAASTDISGWTVSSGSIDWIGGYWQAAEGSRSIDLAGNEAGTITRSFATTPGQSYTVTFWLSGNFDGNRGDTVRTALVSVNGGEPLRFDFNSFTGWSHSNMGWAQKSFSFTAAGPTTTLAFSSGEGPSPYGPAIDNVNVVPLPPAAWLLGSGLLGLVALRRRCKR